MSDNHSGKPAMRSFRATMVAVAWSFIGLRRRSDFEQDVGRMNPLYVIAGALIATGIFIGVLLAIARSAVS